MKWTILFGACLLAWLSGFAVVQDPKDKEPTNVIARHLAGTWTFDAPLSERLGSKPEEGNITFREDPSIRSRFPKEWEKNLKEAGVYSCGVMTTDVDENLFVLTLVSGSPCVLLARETDGKVDDHVSSFYVSIAVGNSEAKDILFIGGNLDDTAFEAWARTK
jgi:hypothetical protein